MIGLTRHLHFPQLDSTNLKAHELAEYGEFGPLWISADKQTSGRGRRGREWVSQTGNLYATLLISLPVKPIIALQTSFITALAVYEAVNEVLSKSSQTSASNLTLKWPNDVLLEDEKLAGILIETVKSQSSDKTCLAIGCGVNIGSAPRDTSYGATCVNDHAESQITAQTLLTQIDESMNHWLDVWRYGENFSSIINAWQNRAHSIGKQVSIINASNVITGTFKGLAPDGALILSLPTGKEQHFHAGDVSFRTG